jgi:hypothetical protein
VPGFALRQGEHRGRTWWSTRPKGSPMSTATLTNAPSSNRRSGAWILRAFLVVLVAVALAAGAFAIGRATKPTVHVPATTVHAVSPAQQNVPLSSCVTFHGTC